MPPELGALPVCSGVGDPTSPGTSREVALGGGVRPASGRSTGLLPRTQRHPGSQGLWGSRASWDESMGKKHVPCGWTTLGVNEPQGPWEVLRLCPGPLSCITLFFQQTRLPPPQPWSRQPGSWARTGRQMRLLGPHTGETLHGLLRWFESKMVSVLAPQPHREMWTPSATPLHTAGVHSLGTFGPVDGADSALLTSCSSEGPPHGTPPGS